MKNLNKVFLLLTILQGICQIKSETSVQTIASELVNGNAQPIENPVGVQLIASGEQPDESYQEVGEQKESSDNSNEQPPVKAVRKCVPILNLASYFNRSVDESAQKNRINADTRFTFPIADINMPIAARESSFGSAMKLLSRFSNTFNLETEEQVENMVQFRENELHVQGLNLTMLNVHLFKESDPKFGIGITIRNTTLTGRFSYDGPTVLTNSQLAGYYRMSIDSIYLIASSNLTRQINLREENSAEKFGLRTNELKMNISNLGYISIEIFDSKEAERPTSNYVLRVLQRVLQRTIKRTYYMFENYIRDTLETECKLSLDCELTRFSPLLNTSDIKNHQSDVSKIISNEIVKSKLNSVALPDFDHQQTLLGTLATIQLYNGSLVGLDRIRLNGDTRIKLQDRYLFINTSIGWSDLRPYYNWNLLVGSGKSQMAKGFVSFNIKGIDFDAVITKGLETHTKVAVDQLVIRSLDNPAMDISGLPGMNRVTRGMVNFFMGRLKQRLSSSIQPVLKQQLERSLNKMSEFL